MTRKSAPKPDDPAQAKRFLEMAREIGVDESKGAFETVLGRVVPKSARPVKSSRSRGNA